MINTQTLSSKTINPEKVTTDKIDVAGNCYENYRYGELVKTETSYISNKVIIDNMEQEKLEVVYTLTFINHKTKEKESFQSSFLPKLNEKYFYYVDNGFAKKISNNNGKFTDFTFKNFSITNEQEECNIMLKLSMVLFSLIILLVIISYFYPPINKSQIIITLGNYLAIFAISISSCTFGASLLWHKSIKEKKIKIKKYIDDLL